MWVHSMDSICGFVLCGRASHIYEKTGSFAGPLFGFFCGYRIRLSYAVILCGSFLWLTSAGPVVDTDYLHLRASRNAICIVGLFRSRVGAP